MASEEKIINKIIPIETIIEILWDLINFLISSTEFLAPFTERVPEIKSFWQSTIIKVIIIFINQNNS